MNNTSTAFINLSSLISAFTNALLKSQVVFVNAHGFDSQGKGK